jgi:pyruvate dehydrogenase E1 component
MNENYAHPEMPKAAEADIIKGMYLFKDSSSEKGSNGKGKSKSIPYVQLLGSGTILREVEAAAELLREDFGVEADIWSVPSFTEVAREGMDTDRWNLLHPTEERRAPYAETVMTGHEGPAVAATDYVRAFAEQIRPYLGERRYRVLGTDGFGRSDWRKVLRQFFEVDRHHVVLAALAELAAEGSIDPQRVQEAIERYGIDTERPIPTKV